jgi:predicted RNA-binding protein YlxR (DUF448 family)
LTRGASTKRNNDPERKCISLGSSHPKEELIRFVLSPDGVVTPDLSEKLPGRGLWVSSSRETLADAIDKNLFSRAAKAQAKVPDGLFDLVEKLLVKRVIETISLARRGGEVVSGFEVVKGALISGRARILIQASDGSERQLGKLRSPEGKNVYFNCLTQAELGLAFGRDYAIHAALTGGGLTKRVRAEATRLAGIRKKGKS